ncbi:DSBA-like thioredoxin domain protein [compost metagenome]
MPNTANAHRLVALAAEQGSARQLNSLLERLFASYFHQGYDIGQEELLLRLARSCGYNERRLEVALFDDGRPYVADEMVSAGTGVPSFVVDQRIPLVGAQPPWMILAQLQRALEPAMPAAECLA